MSIFIYPLFSLFLYLGILFFSSFFGSINIFHSSYQLLLQAIYVGVFILCSIIPVKPRLQKILIIFTICIASSLFLGRIFYPSLFSFLPTDSYQFILRIEGEHNHLGDLAGLGFIAMLLNITNPVIDAVFTLLFLTIMIVSFSKSAFLGVLGVLFILAMQKKGFYRIGFLITLCISIFVVSAYTKELSGISIIQPSQQLMKNVLHLSPKPLLSIRDSYYPQVFRAWKTAKLEQFLFGYGPGNYIYPSLKTGASADFTPTETHNLFLNIFIESGFLTLFWYLIFCILIIFIGLKRKNVSAYLFIYLLINFQTDFTYAIPFFMILFFFFAGQVVYNIQKLNNDKKILFISSIIILIFLIISGTTCFTLKNEEQKLDAQLVQALTTQDKTAIPRILHGLERLTPYEETELIKWSSIQESLGDYNEAIRLIEKVSIYAPRTYIYYLPHQFEMQIKNKVDLKSYIQRRRKDFQAFPFTEEEEDKFNQICKKYAEISCY